jgi:predicted dehydrogenase
VWVTSVHGRYPDQAPVMGETVTKTVLEFADGTQGLVATNHYNEHGAPYAEFRFLGTEGTLQGTIGLMYDYPNGRPDTLSLFRDGAEVQVFDLDTKWLPDAFLGPMTDLMDAIATGRQPATAGRQMLPTLAIGEAAYLSAEERRSVRLSEITGAET